MHSKYSTAEEAVLEPLASTSQIQDIPCKHHFDLLKMVFNEHPASLFIPHCFEGVDGSALEFNVCHSMSITGVDWLT